MAWENLNSAIEAAITSNGNSEITGQILRELLTNNIVPQLGSAKYKGIALSGTNPGTPQSEIFYIAKNQGNYVNFGALNVNKGFTVLKYIPGTGWISDEIINITTIEENIALKADKGSYSGSLSDLKAELDTAVFSGAKTYQELADLPTAPYPSEGTPAKVANDPNPDNNGYYSVSGAVWVKDAEIDGVLEPLYIICTGQSNMENGDPEMTIVNEDRANDNRVEIWNDFNDVWQVADLTLYPWSYTNSAGFYNNRIPFHLGKRLADKYNRRVRIIYEAHGGQSIIKWMGAGAASEYFNNIVQQLSDAGITNIDGIFWMQGEADGSDNDYSSKLDTLISQFRALPEVGKNVPFVAGELAQGLDENGDEVLPGTLTAGEKLNRAFYRQYTSFIEDRYFNVAQGSQLATVTAGVAAGIHFDGSAVLEYSYLFAEAFHNTPRQFPNQNIIPENIALNFDTTGGLRPDAQKIIYLDCSLGPVTMQLPRGKFKKEIWVKRIDTNSGNNGLINIITGEYLNGVLNGTKSISSGEVIVFKGNGIDGHDVVASLVGDSLKLGENATASGRTLVVGGVGNASANGAGGLMLQTGAGGGLDIYASDNTANPVWKIQSFGGEDIEIIAGFLRATFGGNGGTIFSDWIKSPEYRSADNSVGVSGSFTAQSGETITVKNGIVTDIA